jgi:hypothetical protein
MPGSGIAAASKKLHALISADPRICSAAATRINVTVSNDAVIGLGWRWGEVPAVLIRCLA